ncbi:hypothetical protein EX895_001346 [Sporisorium graminicola]|uniref:F-box domain-containing protein n=1 Tax=Sporisorium graminicola TaxID=280036 RepID=A0A4U7KXP1_9BASI|nr:hypothetical protein EX895_001346 [Sporisorium graminicola]TKY89561.1 hypothetical protein EX895_001346 [Sporisorium graminicola]
MSALPLARSESAGASFASASPSTSTPASSQPSSAPSHTKVDLPNELLRHIFLYCDPAMLYTTIRSLNRAWKHAVENDLIATHFANKDWRVGLRVTRKLPSTLSEEEVTEAQRHQADEELYRLNVLNRAGALEPFNINAQPRTVTHVIPLTFKAYDAENVSLRFDTDSTWHSLFQVAQPESDEEDAAPRNAAPANVDNDDSDDSSADEDDETEQQDANEPAHRLRERQEDFGAAAARARARAESARLELDFGLVWRFPDDGQDADVYQIKKGDAESWGQPDPENGWLSRFYCSNFDTVSSAAPSSAPSGSASPAVLQSTPLTRRVRSSRLHSSVERRMHDVVDDDEGFSPAQMIWSDEGHEYMSLDLSLGMEFFVRRSARANQLVRRLEAAAAAAEARDVVAQLTRKLKKGKKSAKKSGLSSLNPSAAGSVAASGWATPLEVASPPPSRMTATSDPRRRAMQNALGRDMHRGASSSRLASGSSPLKDKEAATDDDATEEEQGRRTPEQTASAPHLLAPSMMASRYNSVAPSRQGGGSVGTGSSYGTKSRGAGSGSRAGGSSAPRATFQAKLLRAERMPSRPSTPPPAGEEESSDSATANTTPSDRAGWTGGDKYGRGAYRLAQEWSEELESDKFQDALSNSGVTTPVTWTWSR